MDYFDGHGCGYGFAFGVARSIGRFLIAPFRVGPDDRPLVTVLWLLTWGMVAFVGLAIAGIIPGNLGVQVTGVFSAIGVCVLVFILGNWEADYNEVENRFSDPVQEAVDDLTSGPENRYPR